MMFLKDEKVFSLGRTAAAVPRGDLPALFSELYCYLLVAGLFREGETNEGVHWTVPAISDDNFMIPSGVYRSGLANLITKGLRDRFLALRAHPNLSDKEGELLLYLDRIFTSDRSWFSRLSGRDLFNVAIIREFNEDMTTVARYVAAAFGQSDYPDRAIVPRLYLSVFGNIHLAKRNPSLVAGISNDSVVLEDPQLRYGSFTEDGDDVTILWSLLSAQISALTTLCETPFPGDYLGDMLSGYGFLTDYSDFSSSLPAPIFASALYMQRIMSPEGINPIRSSAAFYQEFLFGSSGQVKIARGSILKIIINLMMRKMGEAHLSHLFASNSYYRKLSTTTQLSNKQHKRPALFQFALESLDSGVEDEKDPLNTTDDDLLNDDLDEDPQTSDDAFDPSTPPVSVPTGATSPDKDTIGLLSFDKTGEGVDEDLYRQAVVALNDKLRSDDTIPVAADVRDALDYWVNGYLYRTAIAATKDQITFLNLQQYLKTVLTKG